MKRLLPLVLVSLLALPGRLGAQGGPRPDADPRIEKIIAAISEDRLRQIDTRLAGFGTRNTMSDPSSTTRGIGAARQWIFDTLQRTSPKLQVSFDTHTLAVQGRLTKETELRNVMAVLPGRSPRRIYVTGHYDSVSLGAGGQQAANSRPPAQGRPAAQAAAPPGEPAETGQPGQTPLRGDPNADAPGANDDGSGTSLTMELARVFAESGVDFDATLVFMCWAGEEYGLLGSRAHAQTIAAQKVVVDADFNNDIVGNSRGGNGIIDARMVRVYSEGPEDSMSRSLARYIQRIGAIYVPSHQIELEARPDRFGRGSDHSSFNSHGYPAIVFRESNENFAMQHSANDTLDGVDFTYLAQNARVNAAGVASLALAPPAPRVTNDRGAPLLGRQPSGYDAHLRWVASPGAAAYRIYWRQSWANEWQHSMTIGNVTEYTMPNLNIDDVVIGVAALGSEGQESLTSAYVTPNRAETDVKIVK